MKKPYCQHVHFICNDLQPMIDFWVDGLGATFEQYRKFGAADGAVLDLNSVTKLYLKVLPCHPQEPANPKAGTEHIGMLVENLDGLLAHIKTLPNGRVFKEPFMSGSLRCAFVTGPENVLVEVMEETA